MPKDTRIAFRASEELKDRLQKAAKLVRLSETALAEACVEALVEYVETHGEIRLPLSVIPTSELKKLPAATVAGGQHSSSQQKQPPSRRAYLPPRGGIDPDILLSEESPR